MSAVAWGRRSVGVERGSLCRCLSSLVFVSVAVGISDLLEVVRSHHAPGEMRATAIVLPTQRTVNTRSELPRGPNLSAIRECDHGISHEVTEAGAMKRVTMRWAQTLPTYLVDRVDLPTQLSGGTHVATRRRIACLAFIATSLVASGTGSAPNPAVENPVSRLEGLDREIKRVEA